MHATIKNHFNWKPRLIVCDVRMSDQFHGDEQLIEVQDRGQHSKRFYFVDELIERGGEDWAGEGSAYQHVYFHADDVPQKIKELLQ